MEWRPLLVGDRAKQALRVVDEIAAELAAVEPTTPGLCDGAAGLALFFAYYGDATGDERAYERAVSLVERASALVGDPHGGLSLSAGLAGVAWTIDHLSGDQSDDANAGIDRAFEDVLAHGWNGEYDYISGLVGFAVYALSRIPRDAALRVLTCIVGELERTAERRSDERTWHTPSSSLPPWQAAIAPDGYYNLGLAHGVPGVIAVLAEAAAAGVNVDRALLDGAIAWQLGQRRALSEGSFGGWIAGGEVSGSRSAWCYGDPGVACALMTAGRALHESRWQDIACELARDVARRAASATLHDAELCHGAMGLALILARFFHITGDRAFETGAITLTERALAMRRPGEPVAGFPMYGGRTGTYEPDAGLLTGAAGIGLGLLALCSDIEPSWDRVMLLPR